MKQYEMPRNPNINHQIWGDDRRQVDIERYSSMFAPNHQMTDKPVRNRSRLFSSWMAKYQLEFYGQRSEDTDRE